MFGWYEKYQDFRVYHQYTYPGLFFAIACGKTLVQFAALFAIAWYVAPMLTGSDAKLDADPAMVQNSGQLDASEALTGFAEGLKSVEIPASVASVNARVPTAVAGVKAGLYNAAFLSNQNADAYVVQLGASTDRRDLYLRASEHSNQYPAVVYPFKKTRSGKLMYGYSLGFYQNLREAQTLVDRLPVSAVAEGVWIRKVGEIQTQIRSVE